MYVLSPKSVDFKIWRSSGGAQSNYMSTLKQKRKLERFEASKGCYVPLLALKMEGAICQDHKMATSC